MPSKSSRSTDKTTGSHRKTAAKRERIDTGHDKRYVLRDEQGRFEESDDVGRSLRQDVTRRARRPAKPSQGDKGDRRS